MAIKAQFCSENFGLCPKDMLMEGVYGVDNGWFVPQQQQQMVMESDQKNIEFQVENNHNGNLIFSENNVYDHQQQSMALAFSPSVYAQIEKQRIEFEQFINLQKERLRLAVQNQRKHQISVLLRKYETRAQFLLAQKEDEIAKASNKTAELREFLKRLEAENLTWRRIARENEAMAVSLNGAIQRLRESASMSTADDAASCCQNGETGLEARAGDATVMGICKSCGSRCSRVVLLPCRHLCSCVECEVFLDTCPVCSMGKKGSIEALI